MKKTLRSLVAGLVAFLMLLSFVPAAFAEDETTPQEVSAWEEDVEKNYDGSITVSEKGVEYTNGLSVHAGNEHTATVDVAKDVTLDIENGMGDVVSAYADADSQANVHVGGDVTGTISNDGLVEVTVWYEDEEEPTTENWTGYLTGVSVGFNADVTVDGSVTATGENLVSVNGVQATGWKNEEDDESTYAVSVTVGKDVTATTDQGSAYGVDAGMNIAGKMDIDVGGDVSASCKQGVTYGLSISSGADSEINAAVGGDVTVQGEGSDEWD